jgi:hypothetical protein
LKAIFRRIRAQIKRPAQLLDLRLEGRQRLALRRGRRRGPDRRKGLCLGQCWARCRKQHGHHGMTPSNPHRRCRHRAAFLAVMIEWDANMSIALILGNGFRYSRATYDHPR